jgi:phosphate starvation-inducible PhoH-like protein
MPDRTLHFPSARFLAELYGAREDNLHKAEDALGVELVSRDGMLRIAGPDEAIDLTEAFFALLEDARKQGMRIMASDFLMLLRRVAEGKISELQEIFADPIRIELRRKSIVPKTLTQKRYLQSMETSDIVFGIGPAGTGKTYLAVAAALRALQEERVERIILTRPAVEAGEALGFLPGDLTEKIEPYLLPLYDAIYEMIGRAEGKRLIGLDGDRRDDRERAARVEIAPLAYMRGRTLSNAFVILDEAQNTTPEQMMMFLTRLGENSCMVITGDKTQIDLPRHKYSGLKEAEKVLGHLPDIAFHYFEGHDVVRNPLVQTIIDAYAAYQARTGAHQPREVAAD